MVPEERILENLNNNSKSKKPKKQREVCSHSGIDRYYEKSVNMEPHPLDPLTVDEIDIARQIVLDDYSSVVIDFREIFLQEPAKAELQQFLRQEHTGRPSSDTVRLPRLAKCQYDVVGSSKVPEFHETIVNISGRNILQREVVDAQHHASLTL